MKKLSILALAGGMFVASCSKNEIIEPTANTSDGLRVTHVWDNGNVDGIMQAYHNGQAQHFNYRMYAPAASEAILQHTDIGNYIYRYDGAIANPHDHDAVTFVPVLATMAGALPSQFREAIIVFNEGYQPQQFTKAEQIVAAAAGHHPKITIVPTNTVYRMSTSAIYGTGTSVR